jgi:hypothetical protein
MDPITRSNNMWQAQYDSGDPDDPDGAPGVFDVRSGAEGVTSDGKPYIDL